jgi:hypothetical protein
MKQKRDYNTLIGELNKDMTGFAELIAENEKALRRIHQGAEDSLDYAALGYTLHNIYCLMENYFLRIAKFFENSLDSETRHRDLVRRMSIEIPEVRPALLDDDSAELIDELRGSRHIFRNIYQTKLKPAKVIEANKMLPEIIKRFKKAHREFLQKLYIIKSEIDE